MSEEFDEISIGDLEYMRRKPRHIAGGDTARDILADEVLQAALSPEARKALTDGAGGALIIVVPSPEWVNQIDGAAEALSGGHYSVLRTVALKNAEEDSASSSLKMSEGGLVVGVTTAAKHLPAILRTVASHTVSVTPPGPDLIATVIRKVSTGRVPAGFATANTALLGFDELGALLGSGGDARAICERITNAILSKGGSPISGEKPPAMEDATEFGSARLWAMDLKADLDDMRDGLIGWNDVDRGCVLHSIPGCGKSLFARSLGQYLGVPVISSSMADLFAGGAGYLDSVVKAQRAIFEKARMSAPCVLFLDEMDQIPDLDSISSRAREWWSTVVLDFLQLLDSATSDRSGVVVVGATNRIEKISAAILRPGRLERAIRIDPPDAQGVERILRHHLKGALEQEEISSVAEICALRHMTAATLMEMVRAARRAARRASRPMVLTDLEARIFVPERRTESDLDRICWHEAGHALVGSIELGTSVHSVSIEQREATSGGYTAFNYPPDVVETRDLLLARVRVLLAGRAAEIVGFGTASDGSGGPEDSDLARATSILATAILCHGMGSKMTWRCSPEEALKVLAIDREARFEVEDELARQFGLVVESLQSRKHELNRLVTELRRKRTMTGDEVCDMLGRGTGEGVVAA